MSKGIFIPGIEVEMLRNASLEAVETLINEGYIEDVEIPQWIPCSKRLPREDEDVLLQFSSNMGVGFYRDGWAVNTGEGIYSVVGISEEKPIAWIPLPKPYGGESNGKN